MAAPNPRYLDHYGIENTWTVRPCSEHVRPRDHDLRSRIRRGHFHAILDRYSELGGRFIDTAGVYREGVSEEIIGRWLAASRSRNEIVVATKARFSMGEGMNGAGSDYLPLALDASLSRLRVEAIDLYQMHAWDPDVPLEETLGTLN